MRGCTIPQYPLSHISRVMIWNNGYWDSPMGQNLENPAGGVMLGRFCLVTRVSAKRRGLTKWLVRCPIVPRHSDGSPRQSGTAHTAGRRGAFKGQASAPATATLDDSQEMMAERKLSPQQRLQ